MPRGAIVVPNRGDVLAPQAFRAVYSQHTFLPETGRTRGLELAQVPSELRSNDIGIRCAI